MGKGITVGFDIAKHVFQVHGVDVKGTIIFRQAEVFGGVGPRMDIRYGL